MVENLCDGSVNSKSLGNFAKATPPDLDRRVLSLLTVTHISEKRGWNNLFSVTDTSKRREDCGGM